MGAFIDNGDGTVTDTRTGLMWMRCAMGQTWDGTTCVKNENPQKYTWKEAMAQRQSFAGHDDWRLPSIDELRKIRSDSYVDLFDATVFPDCLVNPLPEFWSSSIDPSSSNHSPMCIWDSGFGRDYPEKAFRVRLVRDDQSIPTLTQEIPATTQVETHREALVAVKVNPIYSQSSETIVANYIISEQAKLIVRTRPRLWEYMLLGQILCDETQKIKFSFASDLIGSEFDSRRSVFHIDSYKAISEFTSWLSIKSKEFAELVKGFVAMLSKNEDAIFGPPGQSGDPEKIIDLGIRASEVYRNILLFSHIIQFCNRTYSCDFERDFKSDIEDVWESVRSYLFSEGEAAASFCETVGSDLLQKIADATLASVHGTPINLNLSGYVSNGSNEAISALSALTNKIRLVRGVQSLDSFDASADTNLTPETNEQVAIGESKNGKPKMPVQIGEITTAVERLQLLEDKLNNPITIAQRMGDALTSAKSIVRTAIDLIRQQPEFFAAEITELRGILGATAASPVSAPAATNLSLPTEAESLKQVVAWLMTQETVAVADLRTRLLPLDLLPGAVIDDLNEQALDIAGDLAFEEDGESIIVVREILEQVVSAW